MQKLFPSTPRGQALIVIALAAIGFFGITGLAIDGSAKFSDRRHAQNAADTAALAGALTLARDPSGMVGTVPAWKYSAIQRAFQNGYDNNHVSNDVEVHNPPISGIHSNCSDIHFNCNDYVQVIIESNVDTYFARVIGIEQTHNRVEAVASKISSQSSFNFGGNAVVALSPDGCALMSQGGAEVVVDGGGLYSNSDDPTCSFKKDSCAGVTDINNSDGTQGAITMIGGASLNLGCLPDASLVPAGTTQLPFPPPFEEIAEPAECSIPGTKVTGNPSSVTLSPGYYATMPPKPNLSDVTLQPGVYCIGSTLSLNSDEKLRVAGTYGVDPGVFLYFKAGGSFTFNGGSGTQLWGIQDPNSPYFGYLMYVTPLYDGTPAICKINGHSGDLSLGELPDRFMGTIYAPYCSITLSGTSDASGFESQIVGYEIKFSGGTNIHLVYDADSSPVWNIPLQVGLTK